jgi:hypothetical protein
MNHPPYFPDLAPSDDAVFGILKGTIQTTYLLRLFQS